VGSELWTGGVPVSIIAPLFRPPSSRNFQVTAIYLPQPRRLALGIVLGQAAAVAAAVTLAAAFQGRYAALSVLGGAFMVWVTNLYMRSRARVLERSVAAALQRVMIGELIKVIGTIAMFVIAARVPHTVWPALLIGYAVALVASWVSAASAPSAANRGRLGGDRSGISSRA